ncbi:hypothetical protein JVX93_21580 [Mycolicibacterium boenickei]|nr:hypothetical protein JVX93_21580 [Mycolicibacterium boenickei]
MAGVPRIGDLVSYDSVNHVMVVTKVTWHIQSTDAVADLGEDGPSVELGWHYVSDGGAL